MFIRLLNKFHFHNYNGNIFLSLKKKLKKTFLNTLIIKNNHLIKVEKYYDLHDYTDFSYWK
jgi:hypothetical protein